ncbi:uncharacterized protein [Coffea arabica]|uniref:Uncharacterized protein isoform X1 n=1 Tax=Coffea arabica TaxID=13443 RepID=A0A6P6X6Y1_COFAR|nr:uncharacterized protein LOC113740106 [Coffea arabica]
MHRSTTRSPSPIADLQSKLSRIAFQQEQLKIAFNHLHSHIRTSLIEAEDVFASLAVPLMMLVGLKTGEMAGEGRFSSIIINDKNNYYPSNYKGLNVAAKATKACKELIHKQKLQLMQLVQLLKQIEAQVNSSQDDIFQTLADQRASIQKLFQQAVAYVYATHQSCQSNGTSINMVKLLKITYDHVDSALGSVEIGVENLMTKLGDKMCNPMVQYVNELKTDVVTGTCPNLLAMVEEIGGEMRLRSLQLEEARKRVRAVEKSRIDALNKLRETEGRMEMLKEEQSFLSEIKDGSRGHSVSEKSVKLLYAEEDQAKDEKLLWELLRKKRKLQVPDSPFGAKELLGIGTCERYLRSKRAVSPISCRPNKTSQLAGLTPQTPRIEFRTPLGSSPSTTIHQVLSRKRITP